MYNYTPAQRAKAERLANEQEAQNRIANILSNQGKQIANRRNDLLNTDTALKMAQFGNPIYDKPIELNDGTYGQPKYDRTGKFIGFEAMPNYTPKSATPKFTTSTREAMDFAKMQGLKEGTPEFARFVIDFKKTGKSGSKSMSDDPVKYGRFLDAQINGKDVLLDTITQAQTTLANDQGSLIPTTAGLSGLLGNVPGTPGANLRATINTIKSNLAFDRLQAMRDASKTGGALGAVSEKELKLLESSIASLDTSQSAEQLAENLQKVYDHYNGFIEALELERQELQASSMMGTVTPAAAPAAAPAAQPTEKLTYNPDTGEFE
jgi:hypothetical protein